jgi:hypothetical protein
MRAAIAFTEAVRYAEALRRNKQWPPEKGRDANLSLWVLNHLAAGESRIPRFRRFGVADQGVHSLPLIGDGTNVHFGSVRRRAIACGGCQKIFVCNESAGNILLGCVPQLLFHAALPAKCSPQLWARERRRQTTGKSKRRLT